jgi:hypothetical protein
VIKKIKERSTLGNMKRTGRRIILNDKGKRRVKRMVITNNRITVKDIQHSIPKKVSEKTIRRYLYEHRFRGRVARTKPKISEKNRLLRLEYAKTMIKKSDNFRKRVIFSDECKFQLQSNRRRLI